ncbi:L,D-transpeptidase [Maritalea mediterranea]|uniref:L,D-transpeptidase n=1 Tax=Maritalea mediterranea TaxID=2909667 RepID=A0ABS9E3D3_9HYPH|nr:L,D-transpeptidase [Maritalea mediterranea]
MSSSHFSPERRYLLKAAGAFTITGVLAGCTTTAQEAPDLSAAQALYGPMPKERFPISALPVEKIDPQFYRQTVRYRTKEPVGTIIVDTSDFFLYLVQPTNKAIRYGVGLGRAGFAWSGRAVVQWKRKWPTWTPPAEMIKREPHLAKYSHENGGMAPGLKNPLGARALYIFQNGRDTLYRLHGTPEYWSIGKAVSSGCVRLFNHDIIDLYQRVPNKTPIVVV